MCMSNIMTFGEIRHEQATWTSCVIVKSIDQCVRVQIMSKPEVTHEMKGN